MTVNGAHAEKAKNDGLSLVTGATKGIGLALSNLFLRRGCRLIGCYGHDDAAAESARRGFGAAADGVTLVKADLGGAGGIAPVVDAVARTGERLRYVTLNVGVTDKTAFGQVTPEAWDRVFNANLKIPFFLLQALSPFLADGECRIVFIGAVMGMRPHAMSFSYGASKAGLHFLAQSLVKVMSPRGITVNVVAPGFIETDMQKDKAPDHRKRVEGKISLRRYGTPDEVARATASLLDQPYVTGQVLCVDGGYDFE